MLGDIHRPHITPHHCQPIKTTASLSPQVGASVIKSLAEAAFVSSSVVAATVPEPVAAAAISPEITSPSASEASSSVATVTIAKASVAVIVWLLLQIWELCGCGQLPTATILPALQHLLDFVSWDIKTNSCFAFKEGHSVNVVFKVLAQLFLDGSPCVTQIMHLLRTHQLHGGVTSIRGQQ